MSVIAWFEQLFFESSSFCYDRRQRRGRTRSAERVEAHLQITSFAKPSFSPKLSDDGRLH